MFVQVHMPWSMYVQWSEENFMQSVLSFHFFFFSRQSPSTFKVGSGDQTQVARLSWLVPWSSVLLETLNIISIIIICPTQRDPTTTTQLMTRLLSYLLFTLFKERYLIILVGLKEGLNIPPSKSIDKRNNKLTWQQSQHYHYRY